MSSVVSRSLRKLSLSSNRRKSDSESDDGLDEEYEDEPWMSDESLPLDVPELEHLPTLEAKPVPPEIQALIYDPDLYIESAKPELTFGITLRFELTVYAKNFLNLEPEDEIEEEYAKGLPHMPTPLVDSNIDGFVANRLNSSGLGSFVEATAYWDVLKERNPDGREYGGRPEDICQDWTVATTFKRPDADERELNTLDREEETQEYIATYSTELRTPCLRYCLESFQLIRDVIAALQEKVQALTVSEEQTLSITIGNGDRGFTTECVKNVIATLWTFQPLLAQFHPASLTDPLDYDYDLACLLSGTDKPDFSSREILALLLHPETSRNEAIALVAPASDEWPAFGFEKVRLTSETSPMERAFEFNSLEAGAIFEREFLERYVGVCRGVVEGVRARRKSMPGWLRAEWGRGMRGEGTTLGRLMRALGMGKEREFWGLEGDGGDSEEEREEEGLRMKNREEERRIRRLMKGKTWGERRVAFEDVEKEDRSADDVTESRGNEEGEIVSDISQDEGQDDGQFESAEEDVVSAEEEEGDRSPIGFERLESMGSVIEFGEATGILTPRMYAEQVVDKNAVQREIEPKEVVRAINSATEAPRTASGFPSNGKQSSRRYSV